MYELSGALIIKSTKTKTKSDMKVITDFFTSISEERAPGQILPKDLDSIMARFFLDVLKKDGTENEPDSLGSMYYKCILHIVRVFQLSVLSASLHFHLQQTTDISGDFSLRLSKRLADSDLAVIGLGQTLIR
jgi:hypothetical protein